MKIITSITLILLLFSCTNEVVIDIPGHQEKLVIDGKIETGMPPFVILSKSKDIYSPTNLEAFLAGFVDDAEVTVSDGTTTVPLDKICTDDLPPGFEDFAAEFFGVPASEIGNYRLDDLTMVVTLEPCGMCAGAIAQSRIKRLVFGSFDEKYGAVGSVWDVLRDPRAIHKMEVVGGVLEAECAELLTNFFR